MWESSGRWADGGLLVGKTKEWMALGREVLMMGLFPGGLIVKRSNWESYSQIVYLGRCTTDADWWPACESLERQKKAKRTTLNCCHCAAEVGTAF